MKTLALLIIALSLPLAACQTRESAGRREPYVKPGLIMLTADQAMQRGLNVTSAPSTPVAQSPDVPRGVDASAVLASPGVKLYTVNRYVDSADPNLLHEQHIAYRRESTPDWVLDAPPTGKLLIGPQVTDGRQELQPLLGQEITTLLTEQRRAIDANRHAITELLGVVNALSHQQEELARRASSPLEDTARMKEDPEGVRRPREQSECRVVN